MDIDKAHKKTDKILSKIEHDICVSYAQNDALRQAGIKYRDYMLKVDRTLKRYHDAYVEETDEKEKERLKSIYREKAEQLTAGSMTYQRIVDEYTTALSIANQQALDIVNNRMKEVYLLNYNQIATECKRVGIEVINNGT